MPYDVQHPRAKELARINQILGSIPNGQIETELKYLKRNRRRMTYFGLQ